MEPGRDLQALIDGRLASFLASEASTREAPMATVTSKYLGIHLRDESDWQDYCLTQSQPEKSASSMVRHAANPLLNLGCMIFAGLSGVFGRFG